MSIPRSGNCSTYTDTLSVLVNGKFTDGSGSDSCSVSVSAFSCQDSGFEKPDATTSELLHGLATDKLRERGCSVDNITSEFSTNLIGAQSFEYAPEKLKKLGMTSNCYREGNDPNSATHVARAVCHPMEAMTDPAGNKVKNTNMQFLSNLATCDLSDEAMPQVQEDLRKVAAHNAGENGFKIAKPEDLACSFSVLPFV